MNTQNGYPFFSKGIHFHVLLHNDYWPVKCRPVIAEPVGEKKNKRNDSLNSFERKCYKPILIIIHRFQCR